MATIHNEEEIKRLREYFKNNTIPVDETELERRMVQKAEEDGKKWWVHVQEQLYSTLRRMD